MIGWYAHHHGAGHVTRAATIVQHLSSEVIGFSSAPRPQSWPGEWVVLPLDVPGHATDPTAGGVLHWAPLRHEGLRERMALISQCTADLALMVVDVSVEVALLARLHGIPTVVAVMRGDRTDLPHRLAMDSATALLAPWQEEFGEPWWPAHWTEKTCFPGAMSRFDGRLPSQPTPHARPRVLVVLGGGGTDMDEAHLAAARAATPGWEWLLRSAANPSPDLWAELCDADVVVTHGGQNAVAEVAAARRPAVVVAQSRPFDEQLATTAALRTGDVCEALDAWPAAQDWPSLLESALHRGGHAWARWNPGAGATTAAAFLDRLAGSHP